MIPSALLAGFQFVSSVAGSLEALLSEVPMDSFALAGSHSFTNNMNMVLGQNDSSVSSSPGGGGMVHPYSLDGGVLLGSQKSYPLLDQILKIL